VVGQGLVMMDERGETTSEITRGRLLKVGAVAALMAGAGGAGRALAGVTGDGGTGRATAGVTGGVVDAGPGVGKVRGGPAFLHRSTWAPLVGDRFTLSLPGRKSLRMQLIATTPHKSPGESFSLVFRGRADAAAESGLYRIRHSDLGSFELFLSPVGRGVKGLDLEAVINRVAT
jgi:hypothetical protein